ncbi:hypothetical protein N9247_00940 [bacterium]|nr:hypothetical protein [bacterium]
MSSLEWTAVYTIAGIGVAGLAMILLGRLVRWRRDAKREPIRAPSRFQDFSNAEDLGQPKDGEGPKGQKTPEKSPVGRGTAADRAEKPVAPALAGPVGPQRPSPERLEGSGTASDSSDQPMIPGPPPLDGPKLKEVDAVRPAPAAVSLRSTPDDLCPADCTPGNEPAPGESALEVAEAELKRQQAQLGDARVRFDQWLKVAGEALAEAMSKHGVKTKEELPSEALKGLRRQVAALERLRGELGLMERSVRRRTSELVELRRVLQRSTQSGWGKKLEA